ncbi:MAG: amidohydrolase family protein [Acidimicrobiia bacterium]
MGGARTDEVDPGLPIKLAPCSNGEFVPAPLGAVAREALRRARAEADGRARQLGLSRRRFLLSSMGAAAGLISLGACSRDEARSRDAEPGGTFSVPPDAARDPGAAASAIGGTEAIFDVQTHLLDYDAVPDAPDFWSGFPFKDCGDDDPRLCFGIDHWYEELFLRSDTAAVVLSAIPVVADADPLSIEVMERARAVAGRLCGDGHVLAQGHAVPNVGRLPAALDAMTALHTDHCVAAWKVYTHAPGPPWSFTDATGEAFLSRVEVLAAAGGPRVVAVHKGLSGGDPGASPADIGPAAAAHPEVAFTVYHSGYEAGTVEEALSEDGRGVDRLVRSVRDAGLGPGSNVYAELGTTWRVLMGRPDEAAHVLGKLLLAVGPDNILWGTDSIWYGSPQDQIQAFRAFAIGEAFQERFGYPALTPEVKAKILGANAARLYGLDLASLSGAACQADPAALEEARRDTALGNRTYGPVTPRAIRSSFAREHPWTVS